MSDTERLKAEALNEMAHALLATTTIEGTRGVALNMMRKLLDIIYPTEAAFEAGVAKGMFRGLSKPVSDLGISAIEAERAGE